MEFLAWRISRPDDLARGGFVFCLRDADWCEGAGFAAKVDWGTAAVEFRAGVAEFVSVVF
ncbi:hypothetical protein [Prosthecobacter sp.]|uniref:hypothetical protein n=1 Tax=Prosthecobacter sp. TaxID=1965333 RepID=UPI0026004475|nr:hypothetical protein [Prosthecobacter sp.]